MKTEITYRRRIKWCGKWTTTRHHCTEAQIRKEHPEAVRVDSSRRELQLPSDSDEAAAFAKINSTSGFLR